MRATKQASKQHAATHAAPQSGGNLLGCLAGWWGGGLRQAAKQQRERPTAGYYAGKGSVLWVSVRAGGLSSRRGGGRELLLAGCPGGAARRAFARPAARRPPPPRPPRAPPPCTAGSDETPINSTWLTRRNRVGQRRSTGISPACSCPPPPRCLPRCSLAELSNDHTGTAGRGCAYRCRHALGWLMSRRASRACFKQRLHTLLSLPAARPLLVAGGCSLGGLVAKTSGVPPAGQGGRVARSA